MNPAVSIGVFISGGLNVVALPLYFVAQVAGAIAGSACVLVSIIVKVEICQYILSFACSFSLSLSLTLSLSHSLFHPLHTSLLSSPSPPLSLSLPPFIPSSPAPSLPLPLPLLPPPSLPQAYDTRDNTNTSLATENSSLSAVDYGLTLLHDGYSAWQGILVEMLLTLLFVMVFIHTTLE